MIMSSFCTLTHLVYTAVQKGSLIVLWGFFKGAMEKQESLIIQGTIKEHLRNLFFLVYALAEPLWSTNSKSLLIFFLEPKVPWIIKGP